MDKVSTVIQNLAVKLANKELQIANLEVENAELKEQVSILNQNNTKKGEIKDVK